MRQRQRICQGDIADVDGCAGYACAGYAVLERTRKESQLIYRKLRVDISGPRNKSPYHVPDIRLQPALI